MRRSASEVIHNLEQRIARLEKRATTQRQAGKKYIVKWYDPNNSVQKSGGVEYKGKTVFDSLREAEEALEEDKLDELDYNPRSQMTWSIEELPTPRRRATTQRQAGKKYIVKWYDPNNSVQTSGGVEYKGKTVFNSIREAEEALEEDKLDELDYNPRSQMTWSIEELPSPRRRASAKIEVQYAFKEAWQSHDLEIYLTTEDQNLSQMVVDQLDTNWARKTGHRTTVFSGDVSGIRTVSATIKGIKLEEVGGMNGYIKMLQEFFKSHIGGSYVFRPVREINYLY